MIYPKVNCCPFNTDDEFEDCTCEEVSVDREMETSPDYNTQCEMMKKIQELAFAQTDLNLFLDTHEDNQEALRLYNELSATLNSLKNDYVQRYGPLYAHDNKSTTNFEWVSENHKWPWEA